MRMKSLILIFIALGCGLVASIGISQVMGRGAGVTGPQLEMEQILVAQADIDINAKLDAQSVRLEEWPKMKVPEGAVRKLADVEGKFALQRFYKGEPILTAKVADSTDNPAIRIEKGYRAMPVKVEEDTVMRGIAPGDRVDVNVFMRRGEEVPLTGMHTILKNVRVFAVGSNTERQIDSKGQEIAARTVSLLVKPEQARELGLAAQMGKIVLVLRHPGDDTTDDTEGVTPLSEVLNGKSSIGDDKAMPNYAPGGGNAFLDMVKDATATAEPQPQANAEPVVELPKSVFTMTVFGPDGIRRFDWSSRDQLPTEAGSSGEPAALAPLTPAPANLNTPPVEPTTADPNAATNGADALPPLNY